MPPDATKSWVMLAVITQPHGVSGRVKVKSFTEPADDFASHAGITDEAGNPVKLRITGHTQGLPVIAIDGVTRREQAELLRGKKLGLMRHELPPLEQPNRFYTDDLIGMEVLTREGAPFGTVRSVANYGAGDILDITKTNGAREMFAFNGRNFPDINTELRRITIDPPELLGSRDEEPVDDANPLE